MLFYKFPVRLFVIFIASLLLASNSFQSKNKIIANASIYSLAMNNKQLNTQLVGSWQGTNSKGNKVNILFENDGLNLIILTSPKGNWNFQLNNWSYSDGLLVLQSDRGTDQEKMIWISNNHIQLYGVDLYRIQTTPNALNKQIPGTWEMFENVGGVAMREGLREGRMISTIIDFKSDGRVQYQKKEISPAFLGYKLTNANGTWRWFGDVLLIHNIDKNTNTFGKVRWHSSSKFEFIQPTNAKGNLILERTTASIN